MRYCDLHTHTWYSEDVERQDGGNVDMLCLSAADKGIDEIAITDHYEINAVADGSSEPLPLSAIKEEVYQAREKYAGRLSVLFGIELGQPLHEPADAAALLKSYPFDIVIGSVHGIKGITDFYFVDYSSYGAEELKALFGRYLDELQKTAASCDFDTLAHVTYPLRYFKKAGDLELLCMEKRGREYFEQVFKALIHRGKALEINTSGLRQNLKTTMPDDDLISFYKELGGELITVGSDAHFPRHIGAGIKETYAYLAAKGFEYTVRFNERKPYFEKIG